MDQKCIMIVDDDDDLSMLICDMLEDAGYIATHVACMEEAYEQMQKQMPHLILLDINLPDGNGFELCRELRTRSQVPIIFASARTSEDDKVEGLDMGADDYLAKPYSLKELMSRIRSLLRRTYGTETEQKNDIKVSVADGNIRLNRMTRQVYKNDSLVDMKPKEYELFLYLVNHMGESIRKETLLNTIWGPYSEAEPSTLTVHIRWLREKLERDPSNPECIKTVWGVGYRLEEL